MPKYRVEKDGKVYEIESDTELSDGEVEAAIPAEPGFFGGMWSQAKEDVAGIGQAIATRSRQPDQVFPKQQRGAHLPSAGELTGIEGIPKTAEQAGRAATRLGELVLPLALPFAPKMFKGKAPVPAKPLPPGTAGSQQRFIARPEPKVKLSPQTPTPQYPLKPTEPLPIKATGGIEPPVKGGTTPTVGEMRRMYGSERAGQRIGMSQAEVKAAAPGPSRKPLTAELSEMDAGYKRSLADPRGAINPKLALTLGGAAGGAALMQPQNKENPIAAGLAGALGGAALMNPMTTGRFLKDLRTTSLLSGYAPAKSLLGNVGAAGNAAMLTGSTKPITEMLRLPTNTRNFGAAWKAGANPSETPGFRRMNIPGRLMGAADATAQQALERGGVSTAQAQNLLLTEPNVAAQALGLKNPVGEYLMPFQKTNFNQFKGIQNMAGANPNFSKARQMGLAAGYGGAGYIAGQESQNPVALSMMAALTGPFAPAFLLGAVPSAGPRIAESLTPISGWTLGRDLSDPLHWLTNPGFMRFVQPQQ